MIGDPKVSTIVVEHRDRLARFGVEYLEAALAAHGRSVVVLDETELADDLARDLTEVLTSMCARLYGRRSAARRAASAVAAIEAEPDDIYSGCMVNMVVQLWAQDHPEYGKRINANLKAIQFFEHGPAFSGAAPVDYAGLVNQNYANQIAQQNASQAGANNLTGSLFGLGGSFLGAAGAAGGFGSLFGK